MGAVKVITPHSCENTHHHLYQIPCNTLHLRLSWPYLLCSTTQLLNSLLCFSLAVLLCCLYWSQHAYSLYFFTLCSIHESCCYHTLTTKTPSSPNLQLNSIWMLLCGYLSCSPTLSSSSICTVLNWNTHLKSAERPLQLWLLPHLQRIGPSRPWKHTKSYDLHRQLLWLFFW